MSQPFLIQMVRTVGRVLIAWTTLPPRALSAEPRREHCIRAAGREDFRVNIRMRSRWRNNELHVETSQKQIALLDARRRRIEAMTPKS